MLIRNYRTCSAHARSRVVRAACFPLTACACGHPLRAFGTACGTRHPHASSGCSRRQAFLNRFHLLLVMLARSTSSRRMCDHGMGELATRLHDGQNNYNGVLYPSMVNVIAAPMRSSSCIFHQLGQIKTVIPEEPPVSLVVCTVTLKQRVRRQQHIKWWRIAIVSVALPACGVCQALQALRQICASWVAVLVPSSAQQTQHVQELRTASNRTAAKLTPMPSTRPAHRSERCRGTLQM